MAGIAGPVGLMCQSSPEPVGSTALHSGKGAADEVEVLLQRAGQDREVRLAVLVDGDDPDDGLGVAVPRQQHRPWTYSGGIAGVAQH